MGERCTSMSGDDGESGSRCALEAPHPGVLHTDDARMFKATWGDFLRTGRLYRRGETTVRIMGRDSTTHYLRRESGGGWYKASYEDGTPAPNVRFGDEAGWEPVDG